jgi:hypothetical protein
MQWRRRFVACLVICSMVLLLAACNDDPPDPPNPPNPGDPGDRGEKVLFDAGHAQTAGNADWTVEGGYSEFADALKKKGFEVDSVTSIQPDSLKDVAVLILPEPNKNYTPEEKSAIDRFVQEGGGVYFIGDHIDSDRDHDGWDSVEIFNGYQKGNSSEGWVGKTYGFTFNESSFSEDPIRNIRQTPLTKGVDEVGSWAGTTMHVTDNKKVEADVQPSGQKDPYHIHGTVGKGRFAALGDSSPYDDGKGEPGDRLHPNWFDYDHSALAVNTVEWLAEKK